MLSQDQWQHLCYQNQLGTLLEQPQAIPGGLLHEVFKLTTIKGKFAAKLFNTCLPHALTMGSSASQIETIVFQLAEKGIPAIHALSVVQEIVINDTKRKVLIYPWIEGKILTSSELQIKQAQIIGQLLAKMHRVTLSSNVLSPITWRNFAEEHWLALYEQAKQQQACWIDEFSCALGKIIQWSKFAAAAKNVLEPTLCIAHGDLRLKNIIWQNTMTPAIIDWEYTGLMPAGLDLLVVVLNCSASSETGIRKEIFLAVKSGYLQEKQLLPEINRATLAAYFGYCLEWLEFCLQRYLLLTKNLLAAEEIIKTLRILLIVEENSKILLAWLNTE